MKDYETFDLGDVKLLSGKNLKSAKLTYKTYGTLNKNADNVIVLPTFYTGTHKRNEGFFGSGRAIDPNKYFIVSINMFGNGLSSSPSNSSSPQDGPRFPDITLWDNINCQNKLLTEKLKIKKPSKGKEVTSLEFEKIAKDKAEEMENQWNGRRRGSSRAVRISN